MKERKYQTKKSGSCEVVSTFVAAKEQATGNISTEERDQLNTLSFLMRTSHHIPHLSGKILSPSVMHSLAVDMKSVRMTDPFGILCPPSCVSFTAPRTAANPTGHTLMISCECKKHEKEGKSVGSKTDARDQKCKCFGITPFIPIE